MTFSAVTGASGKYASGTSKKQKERRSWCSTTSWMYVQAHFLLHLPCEKLIIFIEQGQERIGTLKWVSFTRAVYCGAVPHACETGCGGGQGGVGTERGGTGTAEEEAQREGRGLIMARCIFILCVSVFFDAQIVDGQCTLSFTS